MHLNQNLTIVLHLVAAAFWLGSSLFVAAVLVPALRRRADPALRAALMGEVGRRLSRLAWIAFALLATTGVLQLGLRGWEWSDAAGPLWHTVFGRTLALKLLLFALVLALSAAHDLHWGPRARLAAGATEADRMRRRAAWSARLTLLLGILIVFLAIRLVRAV